MKHFFFPLKLLSIILITFIFTLDINAETEPNNDVASANSISLNSTTNGSLSSSDTEDFFKINISQDGRLSILDNVTTTIAYNIYLYDADGTTQIQSYYRPADNSGTRIAVNLSPGNYYIRLNRSGYDDGNYTINPKFEAFSGDNEPNDTYTSADILNLNQQNSGNLGSRRNGIWDKSDYWKITIVEDGRLSINDDTESELSYNIYLYDDDGTTLIRSYYRPADNSGTRIAANLSPGTYYLKLARAGYDYSTYGSYTISPDFEPVTFTGDDEPNDVFSSADILNLDEQNSGNLGSRRNGIWDKTDFWQITIIEDGRLTINDDTESELSYNIYLYDADGTTLIKSYYRPVDNSGTRIAVNLSPGIYYLKLARGGYDYTTYGTYTILPNFEPVTFTGDDESNDNFESANTLIINEQNSGNLGSRRNGIWDKTDFWKINILEDGRLTINDDTESELNYNIYLYDADGTTLIRSYYRPTDNSGTRIAANLSPGTYYLKLARSGYDYSTYGSYTVLPDFEPVSFPGDLEPNNDASSAITLNLNERNTGNLGNRINGTWDKNDYWKITIPENGHLLIKDTTETSLNYNIYLYNDDGTTNIRSYYRPTDNSGTRISEKLLAGVYYLRLARSGYDYSTYGSYTIFPEYTKTPKADFDISQDIKTVSFTNKTIEGESYIWDFDDGETSELENPSHTYADPGEYLVSLIASNFAGEDTIEKNVIIYGIKGVTPQEIGNKGEVTITILGGGFSKESIVKISKDGGSEIEASSILFFERGAVEATFTLNSVSLGYWDIKVTNPGKPLILKEDAFNIVAASEPEPWVNLSGRTRALFNRWQTYTLEYGNTGNVDADYVPVYIMMSNPAGNELEFIDLDIVYPDYVVDNDLSAKFDSINYYFDIDTLWGEYNPTRVFPLIVPKIPAGFTGNIQFRIKTSDNVVIHVWNNSPLIIDNELAKTFCMGGDSTLGDCIEAAKVKALRTMLPSFVDLLIPGAGCVGAIANEFISIRESRMEDYNKRRTWGAFSYDMAGLFLNCVGSFTKIKPVFDLAIATLGTAQLLHDGVYLANKDCNDKFGIKSQKKQNIRGVNSFDPNEIVGPSGYGIQNYITPTSMATYTVFFENKSTASAPAQEIWIIDTLDLTKFDVNQFSFEKLTVGDSTINLLSGQNEFSIDIDFRPDQELIGRVIGTFDKDKGIMKVYFNSLDPNTMRENEDPDLGILPPNISSPEGEGNVSFSVGVLSLASGGYFDNKATIIFDFNDAITTNIWSNTIDNEVPTSKIQSYSYNQENKEITLDIIGSDNLSGVKSYMIYVSEENGDYIPIKNTLSNLATFKISENVDYKFYSVATDSVGHTEFAPDAEDLKVQILGIDDFNENLSYKIYPNPVDNILYIETEIRGNKTIELFTNEGKLLKVKQMFKNKENMDLSDINNGIYILRITQENNNIMKKIIIK